MVNANEDITKDLMESFQGLSELELQNDVIIPLLRAKGFVDVRDCSGAMDRGQDLVAKFLTPTREMTYCVQVKKQKYNAKHDASNSLQALAVQLNQAFSTEVACLHTGKLKAPDEVIFITPYAFSHDAFVRVQSNFLNSIQKSWTIMDGLRLAEDMIKFCPDISANYLTEAGKHRIEKITSVETIFESSAAFNLAKPLNLGDIYVEVSVMSGMTGVNELLNLDLSPSYNDRAACITLKNFNSYLDIISKINEPSVFKNFIYPENIAQYLSLNGEDLSKRKVAQIKESQRDLESKIRNLESEARKKTNKEKNNKIDYVIANIDLYNPLFVLQINLKKRIEELEITLQKSSCSSEEITRPIGEIYKYGSIYNSLKSNDVVKNNFSFRQSEKSIFFPKISPDSLRKIEGSTFVVGPPGVGKTTLMRKIHRLISSDKNEKKPIFFQLSKLNEPSIESLVEAISKEGNLDEKQFHESLFSGKYTLILDGLDEMGDDAEAMLGRIGDLVSNRDIKVFLSCRNTIGIHWESAIAVQVPRFEEKQVENFINSWGFNHSSRSSELLQELSRNQQLSDIVATPLYTALICSLYDQGKSVPATEVDLFDQRLDLLLGGWDRAKNIKATKSVRSKKIIEGFLTGFAAQLHTTRRREFRYEELLLHINQYASSMEYRRGEDLISDLISSSLIQGLEGDMYWFGHFTFQEHLVARYFYDLGDNNEIVKLLGNRYYSRVWDMFCELRTNLDSLVNFIINNRVKLDISAYSKLSKMLENNSLSTPSLKKIFLNDKKNYCAAYS